MKIRDVDIQPILLPLDRPAGFALGRIESFGILVVRVRSEDGVTGESIVFTLNNQRLSVLAEMIRSLVPMVVGTDAAMTARFWDQAWRGVNFIGQQGVSIMGISALDSALWDLKARAAGMPLSHLLGAARDRIPAYHSGGLWLSMGPDDLAEDASRMVADGFRTIKLRIGSPTLAGDRERIRVVRQAVGPDIGLMVDANQVLDESEAIRRGRMLEEFDILWFEEPLPSWNVEGLARVRAAIDTPIATGESDYTRHAFRRLVEARAADTLMPDLQRVGGVSEFMRVAHLAESFDIPVSSHLFTEMSLQLMATQARGQFIEYMPWFTALYNEPLEFDAGQIVVPDRPGWGFTLNADYIRHLRQD